MLQEDLARLCAIKLAVLAEFTKLEELLRTRAQGGSLADLYGALRCLALIDDAFLSLQLIVESDW